MTSSVRKVETAQRKDDDAFSSSVPVSGTCERVQSATFYVNGRTSERYWPKLLGLPIAFVWVLVLACCLRESVDGR